MKTCSYIRYFFEKSSIQTNIAGRAKTAATNPHTLKKLPFDRVELSTAKQKCGFIERTKNIVNAYVQKIFLSKKAYSKVKIDPKIKEFLDTHNLNDYIIEGQELGRGANAKTYRIKGTPYILRMPVDHTSISNSVKVSTFIRHRDAVNHKVAQIGNICSIHNYVPGVSPHIHMKNGMPNVILNTKIARVLDELPSNSIKKYYMQLAEANRAGMGHDYIGDNAILDIAAKKITAIDFGLGREKRLFNSLIYQCADSAVLNASQQNKLMKKGLISLFELIKEGKILKKEVDLSPQAMKLTDCMKVHDEKYYQFLCGLCERFNKDSSIKSINEIISELLRR